MNRKTVFAQQAVKALKLEKAINAVVAEELRYHRVMHPEIDNDTYLSLQQEYQASELMSKITSLYEQELTLEELQKLIDFFSSDVGRKINSVDFIKKSSSVLDEWIEELKEKLQQKVNNG